MKTAPLSKNRAPEDRICPRGLDIEMKIKIKIKMKMKSEMEYRI